MNLDWKEHLPVAITVCDTEGKIIDMNEKSCENFKKSGGAEHIGKNLLDCHPEPAKSKLKECWKLPKLTLTPSKKTV